MQIAKNLKRRMVLFLARKKQISIEKQNTILEAIKNHIGSEQVVYEPGVKYNGVIITTMKLLV